MDTADNESSPELSPIQKREVVPPQPWREEHPAERLEAHDLVEPPSKADRESAPRPDITAEMRDARIRALQDAVKSGTYHVTAEELAEKMLQDLLRDQLP
jgi:anti-sigma28 factor (negative regulator of flagellin synthesis)